MLPAGSPMQESMQLSAVISAHRESERELSFMKNPFQRQGGKERRTVKYVNSIYILGGKSNRLLHRSREIC